MKFGMARGQKNELSHSKVVIGKHKRRNTQREREIGINAMEIK